MAQSDTSSIDTAPSLLESRQASYREGLEAFDQADYDRAYVLWKPLAENGFAIAQYSLAKLYDRGGGAILENPLQAAIWYRQAAAQGVVAAQNNLAILYARGRGVPLNLNRATELWQQAANGGHAMAKYNLALSFFNGKGIEQDQATAVDWFERAARDGIAEARFALAQLYRQGVAVSRDDTRALAWYEAAARLGHSASQTQSEELRKAGIQPYALELNDPVEPPSEPDTSVEEAQNLIVAESIKDTEDTAEEQELTSLEPDDQDKSPLSESALANDPSLDSAESPAPELASDEQPNSENTSQDQGAAKPKVPLHDPSFPPIPLRKPQSALAMLQPQESGLADDPARIIPKRKPPWETLVYGEAPSEDASAQRHVPLESKPYGEGSYAVWLASTSKRLAADSFWGKAKESYPEIFVDLWPTIKRVDLGDLGIFYRLTVGPLADKAGAETLCRQLRVHQPDAFCKIRPN